MEKDLIQWHCVTHEQACGLLNGSPRGLSSEEAGRRLEQSGPNEIIDAKRKGWFRILLSQFADLMILILAIAAVISGVLGDVTDTVVILVIVALNATIGFIQELKAEKAMEALKGMAAGNATVLRDGAQKVIPARELVPGDVVVLEAGNIVPADLRLFDTQRLRTDESALTGESVNIDKDSKPLAEKDLPTGDRINLGYKGTSVTSGRASGYVIATGMDTELGRIAALVSTHEKQTPLQQRLKDFSKKLSLIVLAICAVFFLIGWLRGEPVVNLLLVSISLAVAAIPEALPALVTVGLALGARRMAKSNALVRRLHAVESLGSVTHICSDKTGTLTLNQMKVHEVRRPSSFSNVHPEIPDPLLLAMSLNNDVVTGSDKPVGDSTEVALLEYAAANGHRKRQLEEKYSRVAELPFDAERKLMTTVHRMGDQYVVFTKGAADVILERLHENSADHIEEMSASSAELAEKGYRVLGFATKTLKELPEDKELHSIEENLHFSGLAGIADPSRPEAAEAVRECKEAGMKAIMITGDHKLTAAAIAGQLGMLDDRTIGAISGSELGKMSQEELVSKADELVVYARVNPEQKLNIIQALQAKGYRVAMTGDGVNDAPALKAADIGVSMGINGTEVAREASDIILLDDNFATIVKAVKHGRRIYDNILKFVKYIMTGNSGELWAILLAPFFGLPIPLIPIQILWVNLVTDGLPGVALASEPAEPDVMKRAPLRPGQSVFADGVGVHIVWVGLLIGLLTIGTQAWAMHHEVERWRTMAFTVLCFCQLSHVTAIRSAQPFYRSQLFKNKPMVFALVFSLILQLAIIYMPVFNSIFRTQPLSVGELVSCFAVSGVVFVAVELEKLVRTRGGSTT
jgi:P-type Ca2+ transporter type 2C